MIAGRVAGRLLMICIASSLSLLAFHGVARATECGDVITTSIELEKDLICNDTALFIGADDVTIDLKGHTLAGFDLLAPDPGWAGIRTLPNESFDNLRVMNGTILGFWQGVALRNASRVAIENMILSDQLSSQALPRPRGIALTNCTDAKIHTVAIMGSEQNGSGILLNRVSAVDVQSVYVRGFESGLNALCSSCAPGETPNSGQVSNSAFVDSRYNGIVLNNAAEFRLSGNHIFNVNDPEGGGGGIETGATATNLRIVNNAVVNSLRGIVGDFSKSKVEGNILVHAPYGGIVVGALAVDNKFEFNITIDSGIDIYSVAPGSENAWEHNLCRVPVFEDGVPVDDACYPQMPW